MKWVIRIIIILLISQGNLCAALIINELVTNTSSDWVELACVGPAGERIDIHNLYVTMYYGTNEPIGTEPITLRCSDDPATPYDDRFAVVHLTAPGTPDETDRTGDTNRNGMIDAYCDNYNASLWNTDGVVSVDTDDDPSNGGIIDFVFYSNRDGSPSETILSYVASAQSRNQWERCESAHTQDCAAFIGTEGLAPHMSLARKSFQDTNRAADFEISATPTPGAMNFILPAVIMVNKVFKPLRRTITVIPGHALFGSGAIPLFVFHPSFFRLRIFSPSGRRIFESSLFPPAQPGFYNLTWQPLLQRQAVPTGLYLCTIEGVSPSLRLSQEETIYIIFNRYR